MAYAAVMPAARRMELVTAVLVLHERAAAGDLAAMAELEALAELLDKGRE